ncbi:hypothetical protein LCGC14_0811910, partial [marine sediment metagenome]
MKVIDTNPNKLKIYIIEPVNWLVFAKLYPKMNNTNKNTYIGVDNGLAGALVLLENNTIKEKIIMPTIKSTKNKREYDIQSIISFFTKY